VTVLPRVIAHRGSSAAHRDNSWAAFEAAVAEGADAIECDVQATRDGTLVIRHDLALGDCAGKRAHRGRIASWTRISSIGCGAPAWRSRSGTRSAKMSSAFSWHWNPTRSAPIRRRRSAASSMRIALHAWRKAVLETHSGFLTMTPP
jgi:glycerophosphoryl diester phosphodiesterase